MDKKQSTSSKISSYKNVSMGIIILTIILLVVLSVTTGVLERSWHFIQVKAGYISENKTLVTFYQWNAPNGEMIISRKKPDSEKYTVFLASPEIQATEYDIDPKLVQDGHAARKELMTRKIDSESDDLTLQQSEMERNKREREADKQTNCDSIYNRIERLEKAFENYSMKSDELNSNQEKLREAKWQKQKYKCD